MAVSFANGSILKLDGTSVGKLLSFSHSSSVAEIDVTHLGSTYVETAKGLTDYGTADFELLYESSVTVAEGTEGNWSIEIGATPDVVYVFPGFVNKVEQNGIEVNGVVKLNCTIRLTGPFVVD